MCVFFFFLFLHDFDFFYCKDKDIVQIYPLQKYHATRKKKIFLLRFFRAINWNYNHNFYFPRSVYKKYTKCYYCRISVFLEKLMYEKNCIIFYKH